MATILDGKALAEQCKQEVKKAAETLARRPGLAVIIVGNNPASRVYVNSKRKDCEECGFFSEEYALPEETTQGELIALIEQLNQRQEIDGILCQLPLPEQIDEQTIVRAVRPEKDVDGFHLLNAGRMMSGQPGVVACTPKGAMEMIRRTGIDLDGKEAVVVGRSNIVGKPMAMLLLQANCTVTICHSHTVNLAQHTRNADILVVAVGKPGFITKSMVKPGAVVIDVGINRVNGKVVGDVMPDVADVAGYITPVPGGVGKMTIVELLENTVEAAEKQTAK